MAWRVAGRWWHDDGSVLHAQHTLCAWACPNGSWNEWLGRGCPSHTWWCEKSSQSLTCHTAKVTIASTQHKPLPTSQQRSASRRSYQQPRPCKRTTGRSQAHAHPTNGRASLLTTCQWHRSPHPNCQQHGQSTPGCWQSACLQPTCQQHHTKLLTCQQPQQMQANRQQHRQHSDCSRQYSRTAPVCWQSAAVQSAPVTSHTV
jgi:hypothetical protein